MGMGQGKEEQGKRELKGSVIREKKCWDNDNERKMKIGVEF